ncbi:hypothetical protein GGI35DRAFT_464457 [Trichoderma velutinum]
MSSRLEWMYNTCLGCDALTEGATYCLEFCRLSEDNKEMERVYDSSLVSHEAHRDVFDRQPKKGVFGQG